MTARPSSSAETAAKTEPAPGGQGSGVNVTFLWGVAVLVVGLSLAGGREESSDVSSLSLPRRTAGAAASAPAAAHPVGGHLPRSRPVRLQIPTISVDAPFTDLAIDPSGRLEAPPADDVNLVGWYARGTSPGEVGTSIIAGHVDTVRAPAVFASLGELRKGDRFYVERADGRTAAFEVDSVESFDKDHFPDERVYADGRRAEARLITCAGDYDRAAKDYTENLVVFAHLA